MPWTCFDYPADVPPGARMPTTLCFGYPGDRPRTMPAGCCFSYLADVPPGDSAEPDLGDPRKMPYMCFSY
jgi:hypothetical protein